MTEMDGKERKKLERAARKEAKQLLELMDGAPVRERQALGPVVENTAWMKVQLDRAREFIGVSDIVSEYDNGGGQAGIRANPAFTGYEALWKAYVTGLNRILAACPEDGKAALQTAETPQNMLELIRARRKSETGKSSSDSA